MKHHKEIVDYFKNRDVSTIFLFRRNLLRRMVSVLANSYDREARVLNGTHKSHVHSTDEVLSHILPLYLSHSLSLSLSLTHTHTHTHTHTRARAYSLSNSLLVIFVG